MPSSLVCLHEDAALLAFDKPCGLLSVPGRGSHLQDCVSLRALRQWPDARIVHRLDMATSGLLLMARGAQVQARLGTAFARRSVRKAYVALVDDPSAGLCAAPSLQDDADLAQPDGPWQWIDLPLSADWPRRPRQRVDPAGGKQARTRFRVLGHADGRTRLWLEPETGRTHQLRVHLAAIGHPILGDALYAEPAVAAASPRLMLHAHRLELAHPLDGEPLRLEAPLPF